MDYERTLSVLLLALGLGLAGCGDDGSGESSTNADTSATSAADSDTSAGTAADSSATSAGTSESATGGSDGATEGVTSVGETEGATSAGETEGATSAGETEGSVCDGLDQMACLANEECMPISGQPIETGGTEPCLGPREFLECQPMMGCGDAITYACDGEPPIYEFSDTCIPGGWKNCEPPPVELLPCQ